MELANSLERSFSLDAASILEEQKGFLQSNIGKVVNVALDTGIRILFPDMIEEQIINIKDEIVENGFKAGLKEAISSAVDLGKSVVGIFTGKFDNVTQVRNAVKNGGIIDGISDALDYALKMCSKLGKIPSSVISVIRNGKDAILNNISKNIEGEFENQIGSVEKIGKYSENWKKFFENKDFDGMEKEYSKMKKALKVTIPLENTIKEARKIENMHLLVKNKGSFELTEEEIELAKKLVE